ncbi:hypothetical protein ACFFX0_08650 [Citricoccus parietis]|uniref:Uncharacterized protein n=1 Tax=Citricoccus parietis TaxID=592307 RepID=A0ABV5FX72_9MICC
MAGGIPASAVVGRGSDAAAARRQTSSPHRIRSEAATATSPSTLVLGSRGSGMRRQMQRVALRATPRGGAGSDGDAGVGLHVRDEGIHEALQDRQERGILDLAGLGDSAFAGLDE